MVPDCFVLLDGIYAWMGDNLGIPPVLYKSQAGVSVLSMRKRLTMRNCQEPRSKSLPPPYKPYESTFARIFLLLEPTLQQETHIYINLHQFAQFAYIVFAIFVFVGQ